MTFQRYLNIHGLVVCLESDDTEVARHWDHDFHCFRTHAIGGVHFTLRHSSEGPPPEGWSSLFKLGRSRRFRPGSKGDLRFCFFEKAWVSYHFEEGNCEVFCQDSDSAYETCYMAVLSFVGETLDLTGWHRIHGLGVVADNAATILLGKSGSGKSTLLVELLKNSAIRVLSDDTPLVSKNRLARAFPQRIGLREQPEMERRYLRTFRRVRYGEKYVIGGEYFEARVQNQAPLARLVLMSRTQEKVSSLKRVSRLQVIFPLARWLVVGHETPQIWEFHSGADLSNLVRKVRMMWSRLMTLVGLLGCEVHLFKLSQSPKESASVLSQWLKTQNSPTKEGTVPVPLATLIAEGNAR